MGFFAKLGFIGRATGNNILDRVIDMNDEAAVRQAVRDFEDDLRTVKEQLAVATGTVATLTQQKAAHDRDQANWDTQIGLLMQNGRTTTAQQLIQRKVNSEREEETIVASLETATQTQQKLESAVHVLQTKHDNMVTRLAQFQATATSARATAKAADALEQAGSMLGEGAEKSVDDMTARWTQQGNVAQARLDQAVGNFADPAADELGDIEVQRQMAEYAAKYAPKTAAPTS